MNIDKIERDHADYEVDRMATGGLVGGFAYFFSDLRNSLVTWDSASSVIFGAMLSAYAGVKISGIEQNYLTAGLIVLICLLHAIFLWSLMFSSALNDGFIQSRKILNVIFKFIVPLICVVSAGFAWHDLFGESYFYTAIIGSWLVFSLFFRSVAGVLNSETQQRKRNAETHRSSFLDSVFRARNPVPIEVIEELVRKKNIKNKKAIDD